MIRAKRNAVWPLRCPECRDRVQVELPAEVESGLVATARCHRRHIIRFRYDVATVTLVELLGSSAPGI